MKRATGYFVSIVANSQLLMVVLALTHSLSSKRAVYRVEKHVLGSDDHRAALQLYLAC